VVVVVHCIFVCHDLKDGGRTTEDGKLCKCRRMCTVESIVVNDIWDNEILRNDMVFVILKSWSNVQVTVSHLIGVRLEISEPRSNFILVL
jgi:hypothetical protein